MTYADERAVTSPGYVFHHQQDEVGQRFSEVRNQLGRRSPN